MSLKSISFIITIMATSCTSFQNEGLQFLEVGEFNSREFSEKISYLMPMYDMTKDKKFSNDAVIVEEILSKQYEKAPIQCFDSDKTLIKEFVDVFDKYKYGKIAESDLRPIADKAGSGFIIFVKVSHYSVDKYKIDQDGRNPKSKQSYFIYENNKPIINPVKTNPKQKNANGSDKIDYVSESSLYGSITIYSLRTCKKIFDADHCINVKLKNTYVKSRGKKNKNKSKAVQLAAELITEFSWDYPEVYDRKSQMQDLFSEIISKMPN